MGYFSGSYLNLTNLYQTIWEGYYMSIRPFGNESNCLPYILETYILGNGPFENRRFDADFVARDLVSYIQRVEPSGP